MTATLELENPAHWVPRDSHLLTATDAAPQLEYLSVELTSTIIGVLVDNSEARHMAFRGMARKANQPTFWAQFYSCRH